MKKISFKNIGGRIVGLWDKDRTKFYLHPQRDWDILMGVFSLLMVSLLVVSVWLFSLIEEEKIFSTQVLDDVSAVNINITGYKETLEFFDEKKNTFDNLSENKPLFIDPSL